MSDPTAAYHGGAATSVAAGQAAADGRRDRMAAVERQLRLAGDRGLTGEQLEILTDISHQSMGGVILKLIGEKRIHRPGGTHTRKTRSGSDAWICYFGPGESTGRAPRVSHAELLQRFANALLHGRLTGIGAQAAKDALAKAGFRGRAR